MACTFILYLIVRMESFWVQSAIGAIKVLAFVCDIITLPVYLVLQRPWKRREESRRVKVSVKTKINLMLKKTKNSVFVKFFVRLHFFRFCLLSRLPKSHWNRNFFFKILNYLFFFNFKFSFFKFLKFSLFF